jgi:hypothetical protein
MAHCAMEVAIDPFLTFNGTVSLGPSWPKNDRLEAARRCLIANAIDAGWRDLRAVHYSRDKSYYAAQSAGPAWYSWRYVTTAVNQLVEAGLLSHKPTRPSPEAQYRSRFWATSKLMNLLRFATVSNLAEVAGPAVIVRDRETDRLLDPRTLPRSQLRALPLFQKDVAEQNALLEGAGIELRSGRYPRTAEGFVAVGQAIINPNKRAYRRVFRNDLTLGGRWYGPWWQNIPKSARANILIGGQPTVEVDFSACQFRLAYGALGLPDPLLGEVDNREKRFDLYAVGGVDRNVTKLAVLIMLNARDRAGAEKALANEIHEKRGLPKQAAIAEARWVVHVVCEHFAAAERAWFSDLGLQLQRIDGDICADIQRSFRDRHIMVLSVHDSFIVALQHEEELRAVMKSALSEGMTAARKLKLRSYARLVA